MRTGKCPPCDEVTRCAVVIEQDLNGLIQYIMCSH